MTTTRFPTEDTIPLAVAVAAAVAVAIEVAAEVAAAAAATAIGAIAISASTIEALCGP